MFRLMKIEGQKSKRSLGVEFLINWSIVTGICAVLLGLIFMASGLLFSMVATGEAYELMLDSQEMMSEMGIRNLVDTIITSGFLVFAGTMFAKYVVRDYTQHRLEQLFTYPISRRKLMYAKIFLATGMTVLSCILAKVVLYALASVFVESIAFTPVSIFEIATSSLAIGLMGHIAMAVGIWKRSVIATIVTSVILVSCTTANIGSFSMTAFPFMSYGLAIVGMIVTYIYMTRIQRQDLFQ